MICNLKGSDSGNLLNHVEVCLLSLGRALKTAIKFQEELYVFFVQKDKRSKFAELFMMTSGCWQSAT